MTGAKPVTDVSYQKQVVDAVAAALEQWRSDCQTGEITEVFACGTAAVISPVGTVKSRSGGWQIGDGQPGEVTMRLREELLGIQYGRLPDSYGWIHKII